MDMFVRDHDPTEDTRRGVTARLDVRGPLERLPRGTATDVHASPVAALRIRPHGPRPGRLARRLGASPRPRV